MGNVIIGGPLPAQRGFRPYLSAGIGVLSYDLTRTSGLQASQTDFGFNFGLGVSVLFSRHVGAELGPALFPQHAGLHPRGAGLS